MEVFVNGGFYFFFYYNLNFMLFGICVNVISNVVK